MQAYRHAKERFSRIVTPEHNATQVNTATEAGRIESNLHRRTVTGEDPAGSRIRAPGVEPSDRCGVAIPLPRGLACPTPYVGDRSGGTEPAAVVFPLPRTCRAL